jgi:hypothetical protein
VNYYDQKKPADEDHVIATMAASPTPHAILAEAYRAWDLEPPSPLPGCTCPLCRQQTRGPRLGQDDAVAARGQPILDVAARLGLGETRRMGREHVIRCPFHQDSKPSLRLNPGKGLWYCDPCNTGGDVISLAMQVLSVRFPEAVAWLLE